MNQKREYVYTVGNIVKGIATLVDDDYNLIELPVHILPEGAESKSIVKITIAREPEL